MGHADESADHHEHDNGQRRSGIAYFCHITSL